MKRQTEPDRSIPMEQREKLCTLITELREEESLQLLQDLHEQGESPSELLSSCMEGVRRVGEKFEKGKYYISGLIMAGEIMRQASDYLNSYLETVKPAYTQGTVLLGTIEGDIHDLGKNILKNLYQCNGFEVIDLGVDVTSDTFVEKASEVQPDIVAISCLLTNCLNSLQVAVQQLRAHPACQSCVILIGGSCVDRVINDHVGADHWFTDAIEAVAYCRDILQKRT